MGNKTNPKAMRIPFILNWESRWFAKSKNFRQFLKEDIQIRKFLVTKLKGAGVEKVSIERSANVLKISIITAKPGMVIGRGGVDIDKLKKEVQNKFNLKKTALELNVQELSSPSLSAQVVLEDMILEIEKRVSYRRVMKRTLERVKKAGGLGVKVKLSGRLDGVEIARRETLSWGKMPLHTLRADIDYARGAAHTMYGAVGARIWIYKGEVFNQNRGSIKEEGIKNS